MQRNEQKNLKFLNGIKNKKILKEFQKEIIFITNFQDAFNRIEANLISFEENLHQALEKNEFIDVALAMSLFETSKSLLHLCETDPSQEHVPYSLAAISYFVNKDDGINDFEEIDGFEDDELVLKTVISHFNLSYKINGATQELSKNKKERCCA